MSFGWSAGDVAKLIEVSFIVYRAFNDARKNASREFELLTDEFQRFHTSLELIHALLHKHDKTLYFGHNQFKATLEECQEFLSKYAVLGERRLSVARILRTIGWTTEEKSTINRLRTAVHGHARVLQLYTSYVTLETLQEEKAVNEEIVENTREALTELRQLRRQSSIPAMPFITEEPETYLEEAPIAGSSAVDMSASKLEQVAKELDGFSHLLKRERDMWRSEYEQDATRVGSRIMDDDEVECNDKDVDQLQTVLQEIDHKLERVRNGSTRQRNQHVIRRYSRTDSYDSAISGMSTSPIPRYKQHRLPSPTFPRRSETPILQTSLRASVEKSSPTLDSHYDLLAAQISMSPVSSPRLLASSPPTTREHTAATTAVTTPLFDSSSWAAETSTRAPSMLLPSPAVDWSLFCNEVQVKCEGWRKPWVCKLSQRRRMHDCGLSLRAERADGSRFCHDLPASGVAIPHTFHTGANPQYKNAVMFKDIHGHKLRITGQGEYLEKEPKYIFQNPADHKAFQELVFGCELQGSWNVKMIKSEREKESVTQSLRLWRDTHTGTPIILFYTNTRQKSAKTYIQAPKTSFTDKPKVSEKDPVVRLNFRDRKADKKVERSASIESGGLSIGSDRSERISTEKSVRLQWIEIEFEKSEDRDNFLNLWRG